MTEEKLIPLALAERLAVQYAGWQSAVLQVELNDTAGIIVWGEMLLETLAGTSSTVADPDTVRLTVRLAKEREAAAAKKRTRLDEAQAEVDDLYRKLKTHP